MNQKFEVLFLEEARQFLMGVEEKVRVKILYNIDKARVLNDPKLFKKLTNEIWEFRTKYNGLQYRLFAFWDKSKSTKTLVVSTHGHVKKTNKVTAGEIEKAERLRKNYLLQ